MKSSFRIFIGFLILVFHSMETSALEKSRDIVVYGATASGAIAAIAAAVEGADVLLVEPRKNVGGMVTGGLSHNDYGDRTVIGGMALDFYRRVAAYYNKPLYYWRGPEPHVGEKIFRDWLADAGVDLLLERRVLEVLRQDDRITQITLSDESIIKAKVFIDASYEGDLMARAGVSYTIGREGVLEYGESWAGRRAILPDGHQMLPRVSLDGYEFEKGYWKVLTVVSDGTGGSVVADAVKLKYIR